ncbi:pyruvate kinase [Leptospira wolffii]|uniref:Pyruvate kinase n=1 Tax=Leptospira wolffii TaxID=409998 RepID=A0A2M9ZCC6_9LEPT|nr:pyruvate kinase [Leptospira wolffii]EPG65875.1 pyruvate kinase [Leptospira wolffii serovar Khorat str. Khorat-H2]PJZ66012.1 pyruvate kinase [Leptospira wolffii]TGK59260.1 pyruvate kinase [Leptospira wolffii]TGK71093.1 pyruvate kinase [Leptospira wolffii]TGK71358.1 pyruvate kinase [Leptospira wolffii]
MKNELVNFRKTKIICTIGPATADKKMIQALAEAGMNIARLNMSHGNHEFHRSVIRAIKSLNKDVLKHPIAILLDTQGPEIRTGDLQVDHLDLKVGESFTFHIIPGEESEEQSVFVNYRDIVKDLKIGDRVTVDNGLINLVVEEIQETALKCKVVDGGKLGSRKHINLPGIRVNLPSITQKDHKDILFGLEEDVDFIALSFVRSAEDIHQLRKIIEENNGHSAIVAKIEDQEAVRNMVEIVEASDGVMVARGDLGVELPIEELPIIQRSIVRECAIKGKRVIVATHLLESMINNPSPTRAEVTDVANAVFEEADAIMLSGETAAGKFPVRCVDMLHKIAERVENAPGLGYVQERIPSNKKEEMAKSAAMLSDSIKCPAIIVITRRGTTALNVASFHPRHPLIYAFTNMTTVRRKLWLTRSVIPYRIDFSSDPEKTIKLAIETLKASGRVKDGDQVVILSDIIAGADRVETIQIREVK